MQPLITSRTARVTQSAILILLLSLVAGCASPLAHVVDVRSVPRRTHLVATPSPRLTITALPGTKNTEATAQPLVDAIREASFEAPAPAAVGPAPFPETGPACPKAGTRLLLIGDSLSHGLARHVQVHAEACDTPYFHHGVIGSHVTQWAHPSWLQPELLRARPTVVLVSVGGNDFQRHDVDEVRAGIEALITAVHADGAELRWIAPPTMPFPDTAGVRAMWADAIERHDVPHFAADALELPRVSDRIHPTQAGHVRLAGLLWTWLSAPRR